MSHSGPPRRSATAVAAALAALLLGVAYAAVSAYWALGGTGLLDTIGGALEREGRAGNTSLRALLWVTVALKLIVAAVGVVAVTGHPRSRPRPRRLARRAAWTAALIVTLYGGVLTATGLLVQAGIVPTSKTPTRSPCAGTPICGTRGSSPGDCCSPLRWHAHARADDYVVAPGAGGLSAGRGWTSPVR